MMFDDKNANALGSIISRRAHNEAVKQAQTEVDAIQADLKAALDKIGVDLYHLPSAYKLVADARQARVDALVHARLQAVADALMAQPRPKPEPMFAKAADSGLTARVAEASAYVDCQPGQTAILNNGGFSIRVQV